MEASFSFRVSKTALSRVAHADETAAEAARVSNAATDKEENERKGKEGRKGITDLIRPLFPCVLSKGGSFCILQVLCMLIYRYLYYDIC